jgi:prophage regulatory protein
VNRDAGLLVEAKDLRSVVGLSRARVYALMKDGEFPLSRRISLGRVAWLRSDLEQWAASRPPSVEPVRRIVPRKGRKDTGQSAPDQPVDAARQLNSESARGRHRASEA